MMVETIVAKRSLGNGRWDRKLMERMVELSNADNYEEAKEEWIATGRVWWGNYTTNTPPDWVANSQMGRGKCLCGHSVVYHFEIVNTENGVVECVGSDHINTYLIMKEISNRTGRDVADITEGEIDSWIQERTKTMMAKAWMHQNGEQFNRIYEKIKDADVLINVKGTPTLIWNSGENRYIYHTALRKKGEGNPTDSWYRMASIVWRWEPPNNSRAQSRTRGYPTDKLWQDMIIFDAFFDIKHKERCDSLMKSAEDKTNHYLKQMQLRREREERNRNAALERQAAWEAGRPERERKARIAREKRERQQREFDKQKVDSAKINLAQPSNNLFIQMCMYYGIRPFDISLATSDWEYKFLSGIKNQLSEKRELTSSQLSKLKDICSKMITPAQIKYLEDLGYCPEENSEWREGLTRKQASNEIERMKEE